MAKFGGPTPKRHTLWSNCTFISEIIQRGGHMTREEMRALTISNHQPLTKRYKDSQGKARMVGTKHLRGSQFCTLFMISLFSCCPKHKKLSHCYLCCCSSKLRSYPAGFGRAIADITVNNIQDPLCVLLNSIKSNVLDAREHMCCFILLTRD